MANVTLYKNEGNCVGVSKNSGISPKMDGLFWKTLLKWDDLGVPLFLETPVWPDFSRLGRGKSIFELNITSLFFSCT